VHGASDIFHSLLLMLLLLLFSRGYFTGVQRDGNVQGIGLWQWLE
jgi:hypothetical protein